MRVSNRERALGERLWKSIQVFDLEEYKEVVVSLLPKVPVIKPFQNAF